MATNNQVNVGLSGATGTGSFVGSASPTLTGTPLIGASPYTVGICTGWVTYTPTFTGFGTPSNVEFWSCRIQDTLVVRGKFTSGSSTATEARITLGFNGTNANVNSSSTVITAIQTAGVATYSVNGAQMNFVLIESNVGYVTFSIQAGSNNGLTKLNGSSLIASGQSLSFLAFVPVTTWP